MDGDGAFLLYTSINSDDLQMKLFVICCLFILHFFLMFK